MPAQERRRLMILGSLMGLLIAVFVAKTFFVDNTESAKAPSVADNPFEPRLNATSTTRKTPPKTTKTTRPAKTPTTPSTFQVYGTKNPFEPVIQIESDTTTTSRPSATTTTGAGSGSTTTTIAPSNNPGPGQTVTLIDVYRNAAGATKAHVQVGSVVYDVAEGATFAGGAYRVVSLDMSGGKSCGQFLYGDSAFRLCQGQQTLK